MVSIIKRNGVEVPFDAQKIINAINKAMVEVDGLLYETDTAEDIAADLEKMVLQSPNQVSVEAI